MLVEAIFNRNLCFDFKAKLGSLGSLSSIFSPDSLQRQTDHRFTHALDMRKNVERDVFQQINHSNKKRTR